MEPIKQRVNISQICRDAVEKWVNAYECSMEKAKQDGMEEIADELKQVWKPYEVDWEAIGREDAHIWAQKAKPEHFEIFAHNLKVGRGHGRTPGIWMAPILPDTPFYGERQAEHKEWFIQQFELDLDSNPYLIAQEGYELGWTSYLIAILNLANEGTDAEKKRQYTNKEVITMGKGSGKGGNPNWPSRTGNPSGGGRGNNPPSKK